MDKPGYLTAKEAAEELGISLPTLYSYVSRGLIHSETADEQKRTRRYWAEDVNKLKLRKEQRRDPTKVVEDALHWGTPVMESAITLIANNNYYYRGYNVLQLIENHTVEDIAALIWADSLSAQVAGLNEAEVTLSPHLAKMGDFLANMPPVERFQAMLPVAALEDLARYDLRPIAVRQTGARILHLLTTIATGQVTLGATIAQQLQQAWLPDKPDMAQLINAALILCADHELNVSSFTARCVASAGASPYEVVIAGLSALQGVKHGRNTERVEKFLREASTAPGVDTAIAGQLRRGESIPGFGHLLYPESDPRGMALFKLTVAQFPNSPAVELGQAVIEQAMRLIGERPTIDFSLVILAWVLGLSEGGPITLFALGRTIGWIGQALEQYQLDRTIRPRARYVGHPPRDNGSIHRQTLLYD